MNAHRQEFQDWLDHNSIPHICVDEAKKAFKAAGTLQSFHYVVYQDGSGDGPNLLCHVIRRPDRDHRFNMEQWQDVFGSGFASCFVHMEYEQPCFTWLDGEPFTPSFMRDAEPVDGMKEAVLRAKQEGDDIPLIEWLSDNDPLYAEVEDAMAEAAERGDDDAENRLSDWLIEYRRCLIDGEPVSDAPPMPPPVDDTDTAAARAQPTAAPAAPARYVPTPDPQPFTARLQLELFTGSRMENER